MSVEKLTTQQIEAGLTQLIDWELQDGKLHRDLKFKNFVQAWGFMTQVAILAEKGFISTNSADRNSKWHVYDEIEPATDFESLLQEVDDDPTGIFWG